MAGKSQKGVRGFMPTESDLSGSTEAWNIAQYFTASSIALPLKELNELEEIARFGSIRLDEDITMSDDHVDKRRAEAVRRYWNKTKQIVSDTLFKVKSTDRQEANDIKNSLDEIPKYFPALVSENIDDVNHEDKIKVNEEFLTYLLNSLVAKKQAYLFILNKAGLIFREVDEVDLDKLSREFVDGG